MEASDKRKKNNEARMKVYANQKEEKAWSQFEHHTINHHSSTHGHLTWHWSVTPEEHLYNAGYINDYNKNRLERLAKFKEGINRHKDYGLDGLALDSNNIYYGLQAKYYTDNKVSANDIGTFQRVVLRMNKKNSLSKGYLYTSTDLVADLAEDIQCIGDIIHEKLSFETEDKRKLRHQKQTEEINAILRPYQLEALKALDEETESLGVLSLFCGGGKTLISGNYLSKIKPNIIIAIAPLRISVDNLKTRLLPFLKEYESLLVDSDTGGTTDLVQVKSKLAENKPIVIFSTFDSFQNVISKAISEEEILKSFLLVDEVHNIVNNNSLCEIINKFKKGLLMSATIPEELYETIECELVYEYGMAAAIKDSYCVDYNVWLPQVIKKDDTVSVNLTIPDGFQKSDLCAKVLFLVCGMLQTGSRHCIVYLRNREECEAFNKLFTQVCKEYHGVESWTETIDCSVGLEKRKKIIEDFQKDKLDKSCLHIITSVRILDEAVDIVRCDSEFITYVGEKADDKRAVQRLQRGGRLDSSNLAKKNNLFIWADDYSPTLTMLSLLKESDPVFHTKLRILDGNYDSIQKKESIIKSVVQLGDLQKYVEVKCLSFEEKWQRRLDEWILFYSINNKVPNSKSLINKEANIGIWQTIQRQLYKKGLLSKRRIEILQSTKGWEWTANIWEKNRQHYIQQVNRLGRQPKDSIKDIEEKKAYKYLNCQRQRYIKGNITKVEIDILNKTLMWSWKSEDKWSKILERWKTFVEINKNIPKTTSSNEEEVYLARWQICQRKYKNQDNPTKQIKEHLAILDKTDQWSWGFQEEWNEQLQKWKKWVDNNKKLPSQLAEKDSEEYNVAIWQHIQRSSYKGSNKKAPMKQERIDILNNTTNWIWDGRKK